MLDHSIYFYSKFYNELIKIMDKDHINIVTIGELDSGKSTKIMDKKHINIVTIGELDSGKSTLAGHLIYKLGGIDKRTVEKIEEEASEMGKASFKYAWFMDQLKSERERGMTITVKDWKFETNKFIVTLFDTPGHPSYLKNALSGFCLADAGIVLVNAEVDVFEKSISPNSHLYSLLISTFALGVRQIIVAVNKIDLVKFSEERFNEIKDQLLALLKKVGFKENQINFIPVSGFLGDNLIEESKNLSWFKGNTMLKALDSLILPKRPTDKPLRMNISNVCNIGGIGTVITGRVETGIIKAGMKVDIQPNNLSFIEVKSIEMHHESIPKGFPGDFIGINVRSLGIENISVRDLKGSAIISDSENNPAKRCENFTATIIPLNNGFGIRKIGSKVMIFLAGQYIECKITKIKSKIDPKTKKIIEENPKKIKENDMAIIIFEPLKPMVVEKFSEFEELGRFVMIDSKRAIGFGRIDDFTLFIEIKKSNIKKSNK